MFVCVIKNQSSAFNTNLIISSYITTHARIELYSNLEQLKERALYCGTYSVIYKHVVGEYNSPLSRFIGGNTDEMGGSHIIELVSNGPKNYAIRTADSKQIVKVKGFTLTYVASNQLKFNVLKDMVISD